MRNANLIIISGAILLISLMSSPGLADTIFVGTERVGVEQLREDLQVGAVGNLKEAAEHLEISGTERLYCAYSNTLAVLEPVKLATIKTLKMQGKILAMDLKNGVLYLLVAGRPAKIVLVSDALQKIIATIEVGKVDNPIQYGYGAVIQPESTYAEPVDMVVTSDGRKIFLAMPTKSSVDVIYLKMVYPGYGTIIQGEIIESIKCGGSPSSLALNRNELKLYAANSRPSEVIVIDVSRYRVIRKIPVGTLCIKVCPAGSNVYVIDKNPMPPHLFINGIQNSPTWGIHVLNTYTDTFTGVIKVKTPPADAALSPEGNYSIVVSKAGNKIYKVEKQYGGIFRVVAERPLPGPRVALMIKETLGRPEVIYSAGTEIQGTTYTLPNIATAPQALATYSAAVDATYAAADTFTVTVIYPNGFETPDMIQKLNGIQFVQWQTRPRLDPFTSYAKIKAVIYGAEIELHDGWIPNTQFFEWDTAALGIDSDQYKIKASVIDNVMTDPLSDMSDYFFAIDNTPPHIDIEEPSGLDYVIGSPTITVRAKILDEMFSVEQSTIQLKLNDVAIAAAPTPLADDKYEWRNISIPGAAPPVKIEVIAEDELGNVGSDKMVLRNSQEIQLAIDRASPGDVISIEPGIYIFTSNLRVTKNITIEAREADVDETVFKLGNYCVFVKDSRFYDHNEYYYQLFKYVNDVTIDGVTIKGYRGSSREGAIQNYSGKLTLKNCKVVDNEGIKVGAIYSCWMSRLYLENTLVAKNKNKAATSVSPYGWRLGSNVYCGTIYLAGYTGFSAINSTIADNINNSQSFIIKGRLDYDGTDGDVTINVKYGAIHRSYQNSLTMKNCIMWGNGKDREVIGTEAQDFMHKDHRQIDVDITYSDLESTSIYMPGEPVNPTQYYVPPIRRYNHIIHEYPDFIDPLTYNYNISETSPCRGIGETGDDIGARF